MYLLRRSWIFLRKPRDQRHAKQEFILALVGPDWIAICENDFELCILGPILHRRQLYLDRLKMSLT